MTLCRQRHGESYAPVIARAVDEYFQFRGNYPTQALEQQLGNPVHHIHDGKVPEGVPPLTFGLLLNLVSLPGLGDKAVVWNFVRKYAPDTTPEKTAKFISDEIAKWAPVIKAAGVKVE